MPSPKQFRIRAPMTLTWVLGEAVLPTNTPELPSAPGAMLLALLPSMVILRTPPPVQFWKRMTGTLDVFLSLIVPGPSNQTLVRDATCRVAVVTHGLPEGSCGSQMIEFAGVAATTASSAVVSSTPVKVPYADTS